MNLESSGQDGGVGRNPSLPHTTNRRITTNLKSIHNQKHQKIKLHGTPMTKELKKKLIRINRPVRQQSLQANSENCWWTGWAGPGASGLRAAQQTELTEG